MDNERDSFLAAHISDIHVGAFDSEILYNEFKTVVINDTIKRLPFLDVIFIQGDFYHYELSLNGKHAWYSFKIFDDLKKAIKKKISKQKIPCKTKIRIIKGTKSHDHEQLENLLYDDILDIKVINQVDVEYINGVKILYLPEEYIADPEEYYKPYFNDSYNYVIGHGMFEETAFHNYNSEVNMEAAPVYNSEVISNICDFACFGHIHNAYTFKNIHYTGSFSRWCYGEEDPKGFIISAFNKRNNNVVAMPVINHLARKFITINIDNIIKNNDIDNILSYIEKYYNKNGIYKLRLMINERNDSSFMGKVALVQNHFAYNRLIDIVIKRHNLDDDELDENENIIDKYNYLFDDTIDENTKISLFLKDSGYELSPHQVEELINCDILKLIDTMMDEYDDD